MKFSFLEELKAVVRTPEEVTKENNRLKEEHDRNLNRVYRAVCEKRANEYLGLIKQEMRRRAHDGQFMQMNGKRTISFLVFVGKYLLNETSNTLSKTLDIVDVSISEWSGKHTYTVNEYGEAFYSDVQSLCTREGIETERYLVAFSVKNHAYGYQAKRFYEWKEITGLSKAWFSKEESLKAPCVNGYVHRGQDFEGIAIRVTANF